MSACQQFRIRWRAERVAMAFLPFAAAMLSSAPAWAGRLGQAPDDGVSLWRVFGALLLSLGLAAAAAFLLKGRTGGLPALLQWTPGKRRLKLVETVRLNAQASLCIVACDDRELLVLASEKGSKIIERLPAPTTAASADATRYAGSRA